MPTQEKTWTDHTVRAMGTVARIMIQGGPEDAANRAVEMLEDLEARWSRFRPESELSRLNRRARGVPVLVSPSTFALVARAVDAWRRTGGRFDPTGLDAMLALGYDRDFSQVVERGDLEELPGTSRDRVPLPGCRDIALDPMVGAITLPEGVSLDLGGIGKGFAADLIALDLIDAGAEAVCVNLGGDLRVMGPGPYDGAWEIGFDDGPHADSTLGDAPIRIGTGAIATSTRSRRTWVHGGDRVHHLLDPTIGAPARSGLSTVTVLADEAWWAEVVAKAVFVAGPERGPALLEEFELSGILVADDGARRAVGTHWS